MDKPLKSVTHGQWTPNLGLPSQPEGITASWPVPNYTAWWQRHMCVNNLPKVVTAEIQPRKSNALTATYVTRPCTQWGLRGIMHESPHSTPRRELDGHKIPDAVIVRTQTQPTDCYTLPQSDGQLNKSKWQRSWHLDVGLNRFWVSLSENCATLEFWFTRFDLYQNLNFEVQNWSASYKHLMNGKAQRLTLPAAPLTACV